MNSRRLARAVTKWLCFHLPGPVAAVALTITLARMDGSAGMGDIVLVWILLIGGVIAINSAMANVIYVAWTWLVLPPLEARRGRRGGDGPPPERRSEWFYLYASCGLVFAADLVFGAAAPRRCSATSSSTSRCSSSGSPRRRSAAC